MERLSHLMDSFDMMLWSGRLGTAVSTISPRHCGHFAALASLLLLEASTGVVSSRLFTATSIHSIRLAQLREAGVAKHVTFQARGHLVLKHFQTQWAANIVVHRLGDESNRLEAHGGTAEMAVVSKNEALSRRRQSDGKTIGEIVLAQWHKERIP